MSGYTKLFNSILLSTIWDEDDATRIVWITLLAMADRFGRVEASVPGLVRASRVNRKSVERALKKLSSPDRDSRSKEFEGRRIEEIDGGWLLLNHAKYRAKLSEDERREYFKIKKREQRAAKSTNVQDVKDKSNNVTNVTQAEADTEAKAEAQTNTRTEIVHETSGLLAFIEAYPEHRLGKKRDVQFAWMAIPSVEFHYEEILLGLADWKASDGWQREGGRFIPKARNFLEEKLWRHAPKENVGESELSRHNREVISRVAAKYAPKMGSPTRKKD